MSNPSTRKSCVVPKCKNTTTNSPEKLFFIVPKDVKMRKKWIKSMKRLDPFGDKSTVYCCEDHFDIENDMENYIKYKLVGGRIKLKQGIVPHKFKCQQKKEDKPQRSAVQKRNRIEYFEKLLNKEETSALEEPEDIFVASCEDEIVTEDPLIFENNDQCLEISKKKSLHKLPQTADKTQPMVTHDFVPESQAQSTPSCNCFNKDFAASGQSRWWCVQCACWMCVAWCGRHAPHFVLRVPARPNKDEVRAVIEKLEKVFDHNNKADNCHVHVKTEQIDNPSDQIAPICREENELKYMEELRSCAQPVTNEENWTINLRQTELTKEDPPIQPHSRVKRVKQKLELSKTKSMPMTKNITLRSVNNFENDPLFIKEKVIDTTAYFRQSNINVPNTQSSKKASVGMCNDGVESISDFEIVYINS